MSYEEKFKLFLMDRKTGFYEDKKPEKPVIKKDVSKGIKLETVQSTRSNFLVWKDFSD